jgi:hypothetical protein
VTIEPTKPEAEPERINENGEPTTETPPRSAGEAAAGTSGLLEASAEAKRIAAAVLEVLAGSRGPSEAASVLGISLARYYQLETRALAGLVAGCEPRRRGTRKGPTELSSLRQECDRLRRECGRQQTLLRAAQRTVGLTPSSPLTPASPPPANKSGKRRKRRPRARALKVAALLRAEERESTRSEPTTGSSTT